MKKIFLLISLSLSLFSEKTDLLFHLHDAGETLALIPVIQTLDREYLIIASGISQELLKDLPKENIRKVEEMQQIEPNQVITGVASELQKETLDFFRSQGVLTCAFWDNLNADGPGVYFSRAHEIERHAEMLFLPCEALLCHFPNRPTKVVGHPTLDVREKPKLAVWIGGYGKEYEEAFDLFKEGIKHVQNVIFLVQHHPKTGLKNIFTTDDAISIADLVICHQSTAAFQALAKAKPVLYVIPENQEFENLIIQKKLAKKVSRVEDFAEGLDAAIKTDVDGFRELMGIPENSTEYFRRAISNEKNPHSESGSCRKFISKRKFNDCCYHFGRVERGNSRK